MCAPMGSLPLWKGATMRTTWIQNNQWSLEHCPVLCIVQFAALFAQKCDLLPPPFSEMAFSHRFQKLYTYPPPKGTKFWRIGPKVYKTQEKCQNPPCWRTMNVPERDTSITTRTHNIIHNTMHNAAPDTQRHAQHNTTQHNTTQHNPTQHNTTQHNTTQHNTTQHNTTQHNTTQHNTTQHNTRPHNTKQHKTTQHSTAQHNTAQHSTAQHSTAQHNTTQYNTAQRKETQHNTMHNHTQHTPPHPT